VSATGHATSDGAAPRGALSEYENLFDPMTHLPGRALLVDRIDVALARATRRGPFVAVVVLDEVRNSYEPSADFGAFVAHLRAGLRADDTIARIAGRTFVIVLNDISDQDAATRVVQRLLQSSGLMCNVGITFAAPPCDPQDLLGRALAEVDPTSSDRAPNH
jgi:GGDEF domain-containing protein